MDHRIRVVRRPVDRTHREPAAVTHDPDGPRLLEQDVAERVQRPLGTDRDERPVERRVADEVEITGARTVLNHYVKIKVFTERGRESQSKIDIPYLSNWSIKDIAARTIKPDGSIDQIKKEDILERVIVKEGGRKIKAKSFRFIATRFFRRKFDQRRWFSCGKPAG